MKNILVPLGLSERKVRTARLQYAIDFAKEFNAKVYAVEVFKELPRSGSLPANETLKGIATSWIKEEIARVDTKGVEVIPLPFEDELLEAIPKFNLEHDIDLLILGSEVNDIKVPYYLGEIAGGMVKKTEIPVLIIPQMYTYVPIQKVLMAIKSGIIKKKTALTPLKEVLKTFDAKLKLLQVKTPEYKPKHSELNEDLKEMISSYKSSDNGTLFQGVLEHLNENYPDLLCVFRRKRGFFAKLWEKNTVLKKDFDSRIPLLVLRGSD